MRILRFALVILAAFVGPALAQPGKMAKGGPDPHHPAAVEQARGAGPGMMGMMSGMDCPMMGGHTEGVLAFLKTELKITQAQSGVWEAFAAAYRDFAASRTQMSKMGGDMMGSSGMTGPGQGGVMARAREAATEPYLDRLTSRMQMMEGRLAAMKKLQVGSRPLYTALSAEQKKAADGLLPMLTMMGGMM
ncbi:MAG: Spy/CpxP family protein refolding chaperone [Micropepsaceae bacterium]